MSAALRLNSYPASRGMVVLQPVGDLTAATYGELRDGLLKYATQQPSAIVVDLDRMRATTTASLMVFPVVCSRLNDWPGVPMALAVAHQPLRVLLDTSTVPWFVPTYRSVSDALDGLEGPPPRRSRQLPLNCDMDCGRRARRGVEETCSEWGIPEVTTNAMLVACELAENLVRHARSAGWLRVELRGKLLSIAVADEDPAPPRLRPPYERRHGGRGLVVVDELSRAWGYLPRVGGGKVVWAVLPVPAVFGR